MAAFDPFLPLAVGIVNPLGLATAAMRSVPLISQAEELLGALRAYIRDHEVMLSTNISHQHVEIRDFGERDAASDDLLKNMVETAIREILAILNGDIVFTRSYDTTGQQTSCGSGPREVVIENLHTNLPTERAWDWNGEISVNP